MLNSLKIILESYEIRDIQDDYKLWWLKQMPFKVSFFLQKMWKQRIPIVEVLIKIRVCDEMIYKYCGDNVQETIYHLFIKCPVANRIQCRFVVTARVNGHILRLKDTIYLGWNVDTTPKLKLLYKVFPMVIIWQVWKRRNTISHGGRILLWGWIGNKRKFLSVSQK